MKIVLVSLFAWATATAQWSTDPTVNTPLCSIAIPYPRNHDQLSISTDGNGGDFLSFARAMDGGQRDIYVQNISRDGVLRWSLNGLSICVAQRSQNKPLVMHNGFSDGFVMWTDTRAMDVEETY